MKKKLLFVFLIICLSLFVGGYYYTVKDEDASFTSPLQPTMPIGFETPTIPPLTLQTKAITRLGEEFYHTYTACMSAPPKEAKGKVSAYCQANTGLTTDEFIQNIRQIGTARLGADPITCSQNPPQSISMGDVDYEDDTHATVFALAQFGGSAVKIPVQASKEGETWKVASVLCPKP